MLRNNPCYAIQYCSITISLQYENFHLKYNFLSSDLLRFKVFGFNLITVMRITECTILIVCSSTHVHMQITFLENIFKCEYYRIFCIVYVRFALL